MIFLSSKPSVFPFGPERGLCRWVPDGGLRARAGAGAGAWALAWASASATASSCTRRLFSVTLLLGSTPEFDMDIKFKF